MRVLSYTKRLAQSVIGVLAQTGRPKWSDDMEEEEDEYNYQEMPANREWVEPGVGSRYTAKTDNSLKHLINKSKIVKALKTAPNHLKNHKTTKKKPIKKFL